MASLICQPCQNDGIDVEATGYCVDCAEYLCVTCYKYHRKPQPCRHHVLLDADNMPREATSHVQSDTCDKHKGKTLEYHCNSHDTIGCSVCMTLDHTTCEGKSYIPDIATSIPDSDEFKGLQASVNDLINFADGQITVLNASLDNSEKHHNSVLEEIVRFREKLNEAINGLEQAARDEAKALKDRNAEKEKEKIKSCTDIKYNLERVNEELNMAIKYRQFMKLFIAMKSAKAMTSDMESRLKAVGFYEDIQFEFVPNMSILKLLNALETLGTLSAFRADLTTTRLLSRSEVETEESLASESDQSSRSNSSTRRKSKSRTKLSSGSRAEKAYAQGLVIDQKVNVAKQQNNMSENRNMETAIDVANHGSSSAGSDPKVADLFNTETEKEIDSESAEFDMKNMVGIGQYMPLHSDDDYEDESSAYNTQTKERTTEIIACASTQNEPIESVGDEDSFQSSLTHEPMSPDQDKSMHGNVDSENNHEQLKLEPSNTENGKGAFVSSVPIKNPKERVVVFLKDIDVTSWEDTTVPTISGMASLDDDKIVVCDSENKSIKVVDVLTNIVIQTIKSDQSPWDICGAGSDRIAVTFPYSKQITIYNISESLKKDYTFNAGGGCYGIAYANENLFVTFGDANVIKVMDLYGYVVRVLQNARGEKPTFSNPKHITAGPEGLLFYAANWGNDSVTCLTALGHVVGIFTDRDLKAPRGLAVDGLGLVYVCNYPRPSCIQMLTKGLNKVKKLLNKDKAIVNPLSLAYGVKGDWLFVGLRGENVKMFKLTV